MEKLVKENQYQDDFIYKSYGFFHIECVKTCYGYDCCEYILRCIILFSLPIIKSE